MLKKVLNAKTRQNQSFAVFLLSRVLERVVFITQRKNGV